MTWSWIQAGLGAIVQLATTAVMVRLLVPGDFGLVAIATVFVRFLAYFSQMGVGAAIVQRPEIKPGELSALAGLSTLIGIAFTLLGIAVSFFVREDVAAIMRALSVSFAITGFSIVPYGLLRREFRNRELALIELAGQILGIGAVSVVLAMLHLGPWAIVGGALAQQMVVALLVWWRARMQSSDMTLGAPSSSCRAYLQFGLQHSWNTFLEFLFYNVEVLAIGQWYGADATGYYNRSYSLSHLAVESVVASVVRVLFPVLARVRGDRSEEQAVFFTSFVFCGVFVAGFCGAMFAAAPDIVRVLFGDDWLATVSLVRVFALAVPIRYLLNVQSAWLDALGVLRPRTITIFIAFVFKLAIIGVAVDQGWSLTNLLLGVVAPDVLWQAIYVGLVPAVTAATKTKLLAAYLLFSTLAVSIAGVVWMASRELHGFRLPGPYVLAIQIALGGILVGGAMLLVARSRLLGVRVDRIEGLPMIGKLVSRPG